MRRAELKMGAGCQMSKANDISKKFEDIIQQLSDETFDQNDLSLLAERLHGDRSAIDRCIKALHLDNSLRYLIGMEGVLQRRSLVSLRENALDRTTSPISMLPAYKRKAWLRLSVASTLACLLLAWFFGTRDFWNDEQLDLPDSFMEKVDGLEVAGQIIRFTPGTEWRVSDLAVMRGTYLRPGQHLELRRGVAEIRLAAGGVSVLEGPVVMEVRDRRTMFVSRGNATVRSTSSNELVLQTPSTLCSLSNAEVGVTVDEAGAAIVQALDGQCEVSLLDCNGEVIDDRVLADGAGARFDGSSALISRISLESHNYLRYVRESFIAYRNLVGFEGNQNFEGTLGMDFVVKSPILITKLGIFDSSSDGLKCPLNAKIWQRNENGSAYRFDDDYGVRILAEMDFTPDSPGMLVESNRFKPLPEPLLLQPGAYTILASGYGEGEPNGNEGDFFYDYETDVAQRVPAPGLRWWGEELPDNVVKRLDDGFGAILFVGSARWDTHIGEFPRVVDGGAVNRYRAGTFEFELMDEDRVRRMRDSDRANRFDVGEPNFIKKHLNPRREPTI
jgi:hypothetical protein